MIAVSLLTALGRALSMACAMLRAIPWAPILGSAFSAMVQAVVSKRTMTRPLPVDSARSLAVACGLEGVARLSAKV